MSYEQPQRPADTRRAEVIKEVLGVIVGLVGVGAMAVALFMSVGWVLLFVAGALVVTLALMIVARPVPVGPDDGVDEPS